MSSPDQVGARLFPGYALEVLVHSVLDRTLRVPDSLLDLSFDVLRRAFGLSLASPVAFPTPSLTFPAAWLARPEILSLVLPI